MEGSNSQKNHYLEIFTYSYYGSNIPQKSVLFYICIYVYGILIRLPATRVC